MQQFLSSPIVLVVLRLVAGGVFVFYGMDKIIDPATFAKSIANYQVLPEFFLHPVALILPWLEVIAGLFFIFDVWRRASGLLISGMLVTFIAMVVFALMRGLDINCGCSASGGSTVGWDLIARNIVLLAFTVVAMIPPTSSDKGAQHESVSGTV